MKARLTLILLFAAIVLTAWIFFFESKAPTTADIEQNAARGLKFEPDKLRSMALTLGAQTLEISREPKTPGGWLITKPYRDLPHPQLITTLLALGNGVEIMERLSPKDLAKSQLSEQTLGFDPPLAVRFQVDGSPGIGLQLGGFAPLEGIYARPEIGGQPGDVCVIRSNLRDLLDQPAQAFRDPRLFPFEIGKIQLLRIKRPLGEVEAQRADEHSFWQLSKPLLTRGHRGNIDLLLKGLAQFPLEVAPEARSAPVDEMKALRVELVTSEPRQQMVIWVEPVTDPAAKTTAAKIQGREGVFQVPAAVLKLLEIPANDLRDDILANIAEEQLTKFKLRAPGAEEVLLQRQGELWKFQRQGQWESANINRLQSVVKTLNRTKILAFADDSAANLVQFGLDTPLLEMEFHSVLAPGGKEVASLLKFGRGQDKFIYANIEGEPFVYQVDPEVLGVALPLAPKWRALDVLRFSMLALREITINPGQAPPMTLKLDPTRAQWQAFMTGQDMTARLDKSRAERLANVLSTFQANDWLTESGPALKALEAPVLRLELKVEVPKADGTFQPALSQLTFASTVAGQETPVYYGRLNQSHDVFVIKREVYEALTAGLLRKEAAPAKASVLTDAVAKPDAEKQPTSLELPEGLPPLVAPPVK